MKLLALLVPAAGTPALAFFSQTVSDPISGGAGWVGAGLLGAVLSWLLLVHLPAKDKQLEGFVKAKDKQITELVSEVSEMRVMFQTEMERQRQFHDRKTNELQSMVVQLATQFRTAVHDVRDTAQIGLNKVQAATMTQVGKGDNP